MKCGEIVKKRTKINLKNMMFGNMQIWQVSLLDWADGRFFILKEGVEIDTQCCLGGWIPDYLVKLIEFDDVVEKRSFHVNLLTIDW